MAKFGDLNNNSEKLGDDLLDLEKRQKLDQARTNILDDRVWKLRNKIAKETLLRESQIPPSPEIPPQDQP